MEILSSRPVIAVVVCTHNRSHLLERTLASLVHQTFPADRREIIVVDDGSTDDTRRVADRFSQTVPGVTIIHQTNAGLGAARNTGWRTAQAPLVAFLDDDAVAPPDWLTDVTRGFAAAEERLAVLGGPIDPEWESPPPAWLTRELQVWLTVFDLGSEPIFTREQAVFGGANMALRTCALKDAGGFPEDLGRRGQSLLSHEESELWSRLAARGWINAYLPGLRVKHFTPTSRMTPAWFRRRLFWEGISVARRETWPEEMPWARGVRRCLGYGLRRIASREFVLPLLRPWSWRRDVGWQTYCAYHFGYLRETLSRLGGYRRDYASRSDRN